jgi:hypothetical protein
MAPPPILDGHRRVYCPYACRWRRRTRSARALRAYRQHWHRHHG